MYIDITLHIQNLIIMWPHSRNKSFSAVTAYTVYLMKIISIVGILSFDKGMESSLIRTKI